MSIDLYRLVVVKPRLFLLQGNDYTFYHLACELLHNLFEVSFWRQWIQSLAPLQASTLSLSHQSTMGSGTSYPHQGSLGGVHALLLYMEHSRLSPSSLSNGQSLNYLLGTCSFYSIILIQTLTSICIHGNKNLTDTTQGT